MTRGGRRGALAAAVIVLWLAGLGALARRELFQGSAQRLAQAALRVTPGAVYFTVEHNGEQLGFASSTIDTVLGGISVEDYIVGDLPVAGELRRASARSTVRLSRTLAMRDFTVQIESEAGPLTVSGRPEGDSTLMFSIASAGAAPDTQRVPVPGPLLLPTLVPLAVLLEHEPKVGRRTSVRVFDPTAMGARSIAVRLAAESVFVVTDSAGFDSVSQAYTMAHEDTVRAWRIESEATGGFSVWVDRDGRVVLYTQPGGFVMRRTAYELAFENWRRRTGKRSRTVARDKDIYETTAIAASVRGRNELVERLRVRLSGVDLTAYELSGDRQRLNGDTLAVEREQRSALRPGYALPASANLSARFANELAVEPLVQSSNPEIVSLARRIAAGSTDPLVVAERLNRWVFDSLTKVITVGVPSAVQVLRSRRGDCNEHTQLYVALARALGLPARSAAGLGYVRGKFYYHAWPEVWLGQWVAVDPTFGEFPADAAHLRFVTGGLHRQAELLRLLGTLQVDVVDAR